MRSGLQLVKNKKSTTLYLTRHGQTEWNVAKKLQGHKDSPLTELGILHAEWLAESMSHINLDAIYCSSSVRTMKTAEILRSRRNITIIPDDDLREINMGSWEGEVSSIIESTYPDEYFAFWKTPHLYNPKNDGESFYNLQDRVLPKIEEIIQRNEGKKILIVTHAATLKLIMTYFNGQTLSEMWAPPFVDSTSLCKVVIEGDKRIVALYGDTSHYKEGES